LVVAVAGRGKRRRRRRGRRRRRSGRAAGASERISTAVEMLRKARRKVRLRKYPG
jgi:hypothetical protein